MVNEILLIVLGVFLFVYFGVFALYAHPTSANYIFQLYAPRVMLFSGLVCKFVAVLMMLKDGTFIKTNYFKWVVLFWTVSVIASVSSVMHWPGCVETNLICKSIVVVIYSIWFMKKSHKELLDKLKLSWVVFIIIKTVSGIVFNYPLPLVIHYISSLLLITAFVCYLINGFKNKTIFIKHVS